MPENKLYHQHHHQHGENLCRAVEAAWPIFLFDCLQRRCDRDVGRREMDPGHNQLDYNDDHKEEHYDDDDDDLNRVVLATAGPSWVAELVQV